MFSEIGSHRKPEGSVHAFYNGEQEPREASPDQWVSLVQILPAHTKVEKNGLGRGLFPAEVLPIIDVGTCQQRYRCVEDQSWGISVVIQCLMIHGKHDLVIPWESVKHMKQFFKNVHLWENNAHMIPVESPKEYSKMIVDFIALWFGQNYHSYLTLIMQSGFITLQNAEEIYYEEWGA